MALKMMALIALLVVLVGLASASWPANTSAPLLSSPSEPDYEELARRAHAASDSAEHEPIPPEPTQIEIDWAGLSILALMFVMLWLLWKAGRWTPQIFLVGLLAGAIGGYPVYVVTAFMFFGPTISMTSTGILYFVGMGLVALLAMRGASSTSHVWRRGLIIWMVSYGCLGLLAAQANSIGGVAQATGIVVISALLYGATLLISHEWGHAKT